MELVCERALLFCSRQFLVICLIIGFVSRGQAVNYAAPINDSGWAVEASVFECRMSHRVPFYGDAVFSRRAGEQQQFFLLSKTSRLKTGDALLVAQNPVWKPQGAEGDAQLGAVAVQQGLRPLSIDAALSQTMLTELQRGRQLVFTHQPWYQADESIGVALSSISFRPAYRQYLDCLATLLPVNYDQVARTSIYFTSSGDELKPSELRKLDHIAIYVKADVSVASYIIDGHTDSVGKRAANLELSKHRAEVVAQYLIAKGVNREKLSVRWHGERYPITSNRSREGRAQNRRVTIRLNREAHRDRARLDNNLHSPPGEKSNLDKSESVASASL